MQSPASILRISLILFVAASSSLAAPQNSDVRTYGAKKKDGAERKQDESENPPFVGMTKAQALARYGEPKQHTLTEKGEQWVYILNYGEVIGKAFIPFNFKGTPIRTGVLTFGANGRVKEFRWDTPTKD
jgi:hypothetical protein